jgi:hypothetical protein
MRWSDKAIYEDGIMMCAPIYIIRLQPAHLVEQAAGYSERSDVADALLEKS